MTWTVKYQSSHRQNLSQSPLSNINPMWTGMRSNLLKMKMCNFVIVKLQVYHPETMYYYQIFMKLIN